MMRNLVCGATQKSVFVILAGLFIDWPVSPMFWEIVLIILIVAIYSLGVVNLAREDNKKTTAILERLEQEGQRREQEAYNKEKRQYQERIWEELCRQGEWSIYRSGNDVRDMIDNLRQEMSRTLRFIPENLDVAGPPTISVLRHHPTCDGCITVKLTSTQLIS